jgi:hypothetical protein
MDVPSHLIRITIHQNMETRKKQVAAINTLERGKMYERIRLLNNLAVELSDQASGCTLMLVL